MLRRATPASERVALGRTWSNTWPARDDGIKGKRASATPDINMRAVEGDFATGVATVAAGCRCSWRLCFAAARCFARPPYPLPSPAPTSPPASQCVCTVHVPPTQPVHPVTTTQLSFSRAVLSAMIAPHPTKRSRNEFIVLIRFVFFTSSPTIIRCFEQRLPGFLRPLEPSASERLHLQSTRLKG